MAVIGVFVLQWRWHPGGDKPCAAAGNRLPSNGLSLIETKITPSFFLNRSATIFFPSPICVMAIGAPLSNCNGYGKSMFGDDDRRFWWRRRCLATGDGNGTARFPPICTPS
nr:hypothetical protein Itr_chr09CG14840 [Ipomoea trifida]GLL36959.1 hypothetical protein Itr_chr10CG06930 [Ipomoea trifida]